ncbi:MAG: hypothetical protein J5685_04205 [Clostridiales bacterium]|nr:hypothetical protein [Clostridiales bacterium]
MVFGIIVTAVAAPIVIALTVIAVFRASKTGPGGKKIMKMILISLLCMFSIVAVYEGIQLIRANKVIGIYRGTEYDIIEIEGKMYTIDYDNPYSSSDRGQRLGKVVLSNPESRPHYDPMYIWSVEGTDEYIYAVCGYDGAFYRRAE